MILFSGALGRNRTRLMQVHPPSHDETSQLVAAAIRELIDVRDGILTMPGFEHSDVVKAIEDLCCE